MSDALYIVGGGISGLGAAHFARLAGHRPIVLEASGETGGRAGTVTREGVTLETGGKNFASDWRLFNGILRTFHEPAYDRQHPNFHFVLNDRLCRLDKRPTLKGGLALARRLGPRAALGFHRLLRQAADRSRGLGYAGPALAELEGRYDHQALSRHLPPALAQGPARMFTIIMGAAEPDEFSLATLMLLLSSFGKGSHHSLPGTMARLLDRLTQDGEVRRRHEVRRVVVENGRVRALEGRHAGGPFRYETERVVLALPSHRLPFLLDLPPEALRAVRAIPYYPLALINAEYGRDVFTPEMNSIMFDRQSPLGHCSASRTYRRHSVRFTLAGRKARPLLTADDATLLAAAEAAFTRVHPLPGRARLVHVRRHLGGLCAYGFHYSASRRALLAALDGLEGLSLAGDYLFGHNMEGCLQSALAAMRWLDGDRQAYGRTRAYPQPAPAPSQPTALAPAA